jgi:predicted RNase H-like HicB family nuclease
MHEELSPFPPLGPMASGWERRRVILSRKGEWWTARVPSLPGCVAHGRTRQEALSRMRRLLYPWIKGLEEAGRPVPPDIDEMDLAHVYPEPLSA